MSDDLYVEPFDPTPFGPPPTDPQAQLLRSILLNTNKYALTTWWFSEGPDNVDAYQPFDRKKGRQPCRRLRAAFGKQRGSYLQFWHCEGDVTEHFIRQPAMEAYALAISLRTGAYDAAVTGVPVATAVDRTMLLIKSLAYRHRVNTSGGWGYDPQKAEGHDRNWQSALWTAYVGTAAWLMWEHLDEYRDGLIAAWRIRRVVEYEANRFLGYQVPYWRDRAGQLIKGCGDTKAEENAWNAQLLMLAQVMLPRHSRRSGWSYKARELALGAFARPSDVVSQLELHGRQMRDWLWGSNIEDDGGLLNHQRYHPDYMTTLTLLLAGAFVYCLAGRPAPYGVLHNARRVYWALVAKAWWPPNQTAHPCPPPHNFVSPTANNPEGHMYVFPGSDIYYPEGNDWGVLRRMHFAELDTMAHHVGFGWQLFPPAAYWLNEHAGKVLEMQQRPGHEDGHTYEGPATSTGESKYRGREQWVAAAAAEAWLTVWLSHQNAIWFANQDQQIVIDDADREAVVYGSWATLHGGDFPEAFGRTAHYKWGGNGSGYLRFRPQMNDAPRSYDVYAWWVDGPQNATNTHFRIQTEIGEWSTVVKDQRKNGGRWNRLGRFTLNRGSWVEVSDRWANGFVVADAVLLDPV